MSQDLQKMSQDLQKMSQEMKNIKNELRNFQSIISKKIEPINRYTDILPYKHSLVRL